MPTQFFFFGCWNRDNCGDKDYRKGLFDTLQPIASTFDFGVIAGDNVYAHNKRYYQSTLDYGFGLLHDLKKELRLQKIYATIGNHDVYRKKVLEYQINSPVITMPSNMYLREITPYLRVLFIDTNIFSHKKIPLYEQKSDLSHFKTPTGKEFFVVKSEEEISRVLQALLKKDQETNYQGWTIVVGHEPIVSIKPKIKKGEYLTKINNWIPYERVLETLASIPKTVYMCADVHSFQGWNIHTRKGILPMVVVGTGGGEPDETLAKGTYTKDAQTLDLIASEYPYGYCEVRCTPQKLEVLYKPLLNCTVSNKTIHLQYEDHKLISRHSSTKGTHHQHSSICKAPITSQTLCILDPSKEMMGGKKIKVDF